jgi:hypothetical protein
MLNKSFGWILVAFFCVAVMFVVVPSVLFQLAWNSGDIAHKSDAELIAHFQKNREKIEQLLQMVKAEQNLERVDNDWTLPKTPEDAGVSAGRIYQYRRIFKELEIPRGFYAYHKPQIFVFISSSQGLAVGGSSKSYVWQKIPPENLVEDIDKYQNGELNYKGYPVYRRIEGNWYLCFNAE